MKINESYITLQRLVFFAFHGVAPQEQIVGNEFYIDLRLKVNMEHSALTDDLVDTVSYADVYQSVKAEMDVPSKLLEHATARVAKRLFDDYKQIDEIQIKLAKRNPPMGADIDSAGVEMTCIR